MSPLSVANLHVVESIFEGIAFGIVAVNKDGAVIFSNPAAVTIIGLEQELVLPESWPDRYGIYLDEGVTVCPPAASPLVRAMAGEEANNLEFFIQNQLDSGRARWCSIDFRPLRDENGEVIGALMLVQDCSEGKRLSEEVARSNLALQQFAVVAAHDLQEPLRSIAGFTDMLAQYQAEQLDEKSKRCMSKIKDGVTRMHTLINDLLAYSRIQTTTQFLKAVDCTEIVKTCISSLHASIVDHGATVSFDSLPEVIGDASQLSQLFQNLVGNALKFCGEGRPAVVKISAKKKANSWLFSVEDNGIGIAPQYAERVFRIFQRLHPMTAYSGTGIGLAVCQTIVERHGGKIWVESEPGKGAVFYFTIPESRGGKRCIN